MTYTNTPNHLPEHGGSEKMAMEIAHEYAALKGELCNKIVEFTQNKNKELHVLFSARSDVIKQYEKDAERYRELEKKFPGQLSDQENEEFMTSYHKILGHLKNRDFTWEHFHKERQKKQKELTQGFREEHKGLINQYKEMNEEHKNNERIVRLFIRTLKNRKIADLERKDIGFESVDVPRYIWDKQQIESAGVSVEELLKTLTPREAEIVKTYFAGGDINEFCEKFNLTSQRIRQLKNRALRKMRRSESVKNEEE